MLTHTKVVSTAAGTTVAAASPGSTNDRTLTTAQQTNAGRVTTMFTSKATDDSQLMGAEITFGSTLIGHVEGLIRDPISQRVRRLVTSYGLTGRRVGVPMDWVVNRSASRLTLAVGTPSLDDLQDWARA